MFILVKLATILWKLSSSSMESLCWLPANSHKSEPTFLEADLSALVKLSDAQICILTANSWEILSENHLAKLLLDSWHPKSVWDNKFILFKATNFRVICYIAMDSYLTALFVDYGLGELNLIIPTFKPWQS